MEQCWRIDVYSLKEAITFETRVRTLLEYIKDDEFFYDLAHNARSLIVYNPMFTIPESNWNASKRVLGTRKDLAENCLWLLGILLRSYQTKARIEVKEDRFSCRELG